MKICICSSMSFYHQFQALKKELEDKGHTVVTPELEFESTGTKSIGSFFDDHGGVDAFAADHEVWKKKGNAILKHLTYIDTCDAVLITNYEKKGIPSYIGANVFLEIGYAFGRGKTIYLLNDIPAVSAFKEELLGMQPIIVGGNLENILN